MVASLLIHIFRIKIRYLCDLTHGLLKMMCNGDSREWRLRVMWRGRKFCLPPARLMPQLGLDFVLLLRSLGVAKCRERFSLSQKTEKILPDVDHR